MRIHIIALGTRGDVQPALALALRLKQAGHEIGFLAGANFESWIKRYGIDFTPTIDIEETMRSPDGIKWVEKGTNPSEQFKYMRRLLNQYGDEIVDNITSMRHADLLLSGFVSDPFTQTISEKYGVPHITTLLQPLHNTRSGASMLQPFLPRHYSPLNLVSGLFAYWYLWRLSSDAVNRNRVRLDLNPHTTRTFKRAMTPVHALCAYSEHVIPRPADYPDNIHSVGYWFLDEHTDWHPSPELTAFLNAGPKPLYIGFGSMAIGNPQENLEMTLQALRASGQRGVFLKGWSQVDTSNLPDFIHVVDSVPHDWIFSRVAGVVHHGGAGTTAAGIRAGVPSMIIPHMADQPFWGRRTFELGIGVKPINRPKLTVEGLSAGFRELGESETLRTNARILGEKVRAEDGLGNAVRVIEQVMQKRSRA